MMLAAAVLFAAGALAQSTAVMRVDDAQVFNPTTNRAGIQYGANWEQNDEVGARYRGTYTETSTPASYLMFSFRGTGITYYADKSPDSGTVVLALDGQLRPNLTWTNVGSTRTYQQRMWSITDLAPGDHQLVLGTANQHANRTGVVGLDYFGVTPINDDETYVPQNLGPGAFAVPVNAAIVDNEDSSIVYDRSWRRYGPESTGPVPLFFSGTQRSATVPGASLNFTFTGTEVYYFSDDYWGNANVSISVDGAQEDIVRTATPGTTWISQRLTWSKKGLSAGKHVVTVKHVGRSGEYANLDFFMYLPSSPSSEPGASESNAIPVGVIVGSVLGGFVGFVLIVLGAFMLYRRRLAIKDQEAAPTMDEKVAGLHKLTLQPSISQASLGTVDEKDAKAIV